MSFPCLEFALVFGSPVDLTHTCKSVVMKRRNDWSPLARYTLIFSAFALMMVIVFGNKGLIERKVLLRNKQAVVREIRKAKVENEVLRAQIESIRRDPSEVERLAREKFGLGREDEKVFQLVPRKK